MDGTISKIHVRPVVDGYERVVDYVFKTIKRGRVSYDEGMLVLPRTRDELTSKAWWSRAGRVSASGLNGSIDVSRLNFTE